MNRSQLVVAVLVLIAGGASHAQQYEDCGLEPPGTEWGAPPEPRLHELPGLMPGEGPFVVRESRPAKQPIHFGSASSKLRTGALSGKSVYVSAGHGYTGPAAWTTQRGVTNGVVEDIVSTETIAQYLVPLLQNAGAYVVTARERDLNTNLNVVDNSEADYSEIGPTTTFTTSGSMVPGYGPPPSPIPNGTNVFTLGNNRLMEANVGAATASAQFVFNVPADGDYDVSIAYSQFSYRVPDAHFVVKHAGGESHFRVNQRRHGATWVFLGRFFFRKGKDPAKGAVVAMNDSSVTGNLSLDAVRIGGGMGMVAATADGTTSNRPRFEECARYHVQYMGAPTTVYDSPSLTDRNDDISSRPRFAAWHHEAGEDAVYVAWHTNACGATPCTARGTDTYVYGTNPPDGTYQFSGVAGSDVLAQAVHAELVKDVRAAIDPLWKDRGIRSAYFGEVNPNNNPEMPAILLEVAFHHNATDADFLKEPAFRYTAARAIAQGIMKYFAAKDGVPLTLPPEPPIGVFARNTPAGITVGWKAAATDAKDLAGAAATGFRLYSSDDGHAWDDGVDVTGTSVNMVLGAGMVKYFRVAATNAGGESFPSAVVAAGVPSGGGAPSVLIVNGFDRLDATMARSESLPNVGTAVRVFQERMNDGTYARRHGLAIAQNGHGFDAATMAAVTNGSVTLAAYPAVDWFVGRGEKGNGGMSNANENALRTYVEGGGRLILTGSNVASTLSMGDATDTSFLAEILHASNGMGMSALTVNGSAGEALDGISGVVLDNGLKGAYPAGTMDALGVAPGGVQIAEFGGTMAIAGVRSPSPRSVAFLTFPFETVVSETSRKDVMGRLLTTLAVPAVVPWPDAGGGAMDAGSDPDAGTPELDAGVVTDAGIEEPPPPITFAYLSPDHPYPNANAGGCGCGTSGFGGVASLLGLASFAALRLRRRARGWP